MYDNNNNNSILIKKKKKHHLKSPIAMYTYRMNNFEAHYTR